MPGTSSRSLKRPFNHGNSEESISQRTRSSMIRPPVGSNVSRSTTTPRREHSVASELNGEGISELDKPKDVSEEIGERHVTPNKKVPPTPFVRAGSTSHFVKGQSIFVYDDVCNWWDKGTFVENGEKDSYRVERETSTEICTVPRVYVASVSTAMEEQYIRDRKQKKEARAKQQTSNDSAQAASAVTNNERDLGYYLVMGSYVMTLHREENTRFVMFPVAETSKANDTIVFPVCRTEGPFRELMRQICTCNVVVRSDDDTVLDIRGRRQCKDDQYVYDAGSSAKTGPPSELLMVFCLRFDPAHKELLFYPTDARIPCVNANNIDNICFGLVDKFNFNECSRHCLGQVLGGSAGGEGAAQFAEFQSVVVSMALAVQEDLFQMENDRNSSEATKADGTPDQDDDEMPHDNELLRAAQVKLHELNSKIDQLCEGFELKEQRLEEEYKLKFEELSERVRVLERIVNGFASVEDVHAAGVEGTEHPPVVPSNATDPSNDSRIQAQTGDRIE